jgi:hypothetical protein
MLGTLFLYTIVHRILPLIFAQSIVLNMPNELNTIKTDIFVTVYVDFYVDFFFLTY